MTSPTTHTIQTQIYLLKKTQGEGIAADNRIWLRMERNQDIVHRKIREGWVVQEFPKLKGFSVLLPKESFALAKTMIFGKASNTPYFGKRCTFSAYS